ncbi:MAG: hypothetical protein N2Z64_05735 [Dictyoglomus thermophilum]|nr:hypothetical protein [Dictyoglomus thermophilum]MCX7720769.1 hypothetical protein [Dictyoglomus thermophilum]
MQRSERYPKPKDLPLLYDLPDPFTFFDGSRVENLEDWDRRRQEIKELYQFYMYGYYPDTSEEEVDYKVNENTVSIRIRKENRETTFNARFSLPEEKNFNPPYPVIVVIGFIGEHIPYITSKGYSVVIFDPYQVAKDDFTHQGAFYEIYPYSKDVRKSAGVLMAWGWGASKVMDIICKGAFSKIDPYKSVITGFSRFGKAAILAGAFDERFLIVNPHASGAGGTALFRCASPSSEPFSNLQSPSEAHWFNDIFREFDDVNRLPFDQHLLLALCAPRGLIITGGYADLWTDPEGTWRAFLEAKKVYEFLGYAERIRFAYREGGHTICREDIDNLIDFCEFIFNKTKRGG